MVIAACSSSETVETPEVTEAPAPATTEAPAPAPAPATTAAPAPETTTTEAGPEIGSAENPIQVLFVPSVSAEEIIAGGEILKSVLEEATGLVYEVSVPTSYAATINEMCASSDNTIGFIPATAYVLGNDLCDIDVAMKSKRYGYTEYWAEFIVARDSDVTTIADLAGLKWAYPDAGSTSGFLVPSGMFAKLGIEPGESFEAGGHSATVRAVYNGEADFGTVYYSPSIDADKNVVWDGTSAGADVPDPESCEINDAGKIDCGGVFPRDARPNIREEAPDVIQKVKIVELSEPIPNDTVSFSPDLPQDLRDKFIAALTDFAANDPEQFSAAFDAYSWSSVTLTNDSEFDFIRSLVQSLDLTVEDI